MRRIGKIKRFRENFVTVSYTPFAINRRKWWYVGNKMPTSKHSFRNVQHRTLSNAAPIYATRAQIAERYSISKRHLDYLIKDGVIPSVRLGKRCLRIPIAQADAYLESLQTGGIKIRR